LLRGGGPVPAHPGRRGLCPALPPPPLPVPAGAPRLPPAGGRRGQRARDRRGCVIALAADARLMAEGVGRIGLPELLVGVPFPTAALEVVRLAVPRERVQS